MYTKSFSISDLPDKLSEDIRLSIPLALRRGSLRDNEQKSIESAIKNLKGIAERTERWDWSDQNILDFGCGVKIAQTLIQYDIEVQSYTGMDVYSPMIQFLENHIDLPNFNFYQVPFQNEMYNPQGIKMQPNSKLPGDLQSYDLIILQSVFTHFAPKDFWVLLSILRRYATKNTRMLFTCFIDNEMEQDFLDTVPDRPLLKAYYKENFIRRMLHKTSWKPISLHNPSFLMNHHFVCEPLFR